MDRSRRVRAFLSRKQLLRASRDQLDIDVTDLAPSEAADLILRRLDIQEDHEWDVDPAGWVRQQRRADPRRGG